MTANIDTILIIFSSDFLELTPFNTRGLSELRNIK